jgi:hypothetical protein
MSDYGTYLLFQQLLASNYILVLFLSVLGLFFIIKKIKITLDFDKYNNYGAFDQININHRICFQHLFFFCSLSVSLRTICCRMHTVQWDIL